MKIPHPDNPQHTDNLASLSLLEAQGWRGIDASLEISVLEYYFAWRELEEPDEHGDDHIFLYALADRNGLRFDRVSMGSARDLRKEYGWVNWPSFLSTVGLSDEEWDALPYAQKVYDLFNVYGYENIFGSSYWEGFTIKNK